MTEVMEILQVSGYPSYIFIDSKGEYKKGAINRISMIDPEDIKKLIN